MEFIKLDTLSLHIMDRENINDCKFVKKLVNNEGIKKWVHGISNIMSSNENKEFFNKGFIVKDNDLYIGYLGIGALNSEKSVYLRAGIDNNVIGKGYGKKILNEITEYIFFNYSEVESIKLKIDKENIASLKTANSCGYKWLHDDYYVKYNPYIKKI